MANSNQKASLKISQDVIETIAVVAAKEISGVADIENTPANLGWKQNPVEIKITNGIAEISIRLILDYGAKIAEVSQKVQDNIKENVQTMTGIMVSKVHISIEGIALPQPKLETEKTQNIDIQ